MLELFDKVTLISVGEDWELKIPPPSLPELFPLKVTLISVGEEAEEFDIPPPQRVDVFREKVTSISVGDELPLDIPPPSLPELF